MKKFTMIACFLFLMNVASRAISWESEIENHRDLMDEKTYHLIKAQYQAYQSNTLPKIADEEIKAIPIKESGELLVDVREKNTSRIQMLPDPQTPADSPECNSGFASASKIREEIYKKLEEALLNLDKFSSRFGFKSGKVSIKVFEGLRDLATQEMIFQHKVREIQGSNPQMREEEVFKETSKWVSPVENNVPVHSTGGAIDIRLFDQERNEFIDMGPFGVVWGENKIAPTFSNDITEIQLKNRLFLLIAATRAGLINYPYEWWHLSDGDRYAAFWLESDPSHRYAVYNSIAN